MVRIIERHGIAKVEYRITIANTENRSPIALKWKITSPILIVYR